jgi:Protein of unknown function (DUF4038)
VAVAYDSVGVAAGGSSPQTYTHTTVAASTTVVVGASIDGVNVGATTSCTLGGLGMTSLGQITSGTGTTGIIQGWVMHGVAAGGHTIIVTCSTAADIEAGSMAYSGAGQVGAPVLTHSSVNGTTASAAVTGTTTGNMVAGFVACGDSISSTTQTFRWMDNQMAGAGQATGNGAGADAASTGGTVTMSWTIATSPWACLAVEVQPAAPPPPPLVSRARPGKSNRRRFHHRQQPWPLPPGPIVHYATGAGSVTANVTQAVTATAVGAGSVAALPAPSVITGLAGGGHGWFVDQYNQPRLYWADIAYGLPANAGRYTNTYQQDFDQFHALRASQGLNANACHPFGHSHTGCNNDVGNTWDGVYPFTINGSAATLTGQAGTVGLNSTFWTRIDYMFTSAAANGMTILLNISMSCDMPTGASHGFANGVFQHATTAQIQTASQLIATRYLTTPNLIWYYGDDYYNDDNTNYNAMQTGIAASGDTRPATIEYYSTGTTARRDISGSPTGTPFPWGASYATFNWCYEYWVTYFAIEFAYQENSQIPVVWGDGFFYEDGGNAAGDAHIMRNMVWWALASGARGCTMGTESGVQWPTGELTVLGAQAWFNNSAKAVRTYFEGLPGWYNLLPDLSSALVTAGRGSRQAYNAGQWGNVNIGTDNYVCASRTPDGSLAVIYCAVAFSITIDQTQMGAGYTATWVDPVTAATSSGTPGATYNSGTAKGSNSIGDADWVLVLQGPPLSIPVSHPVQPPIYGWMGSYY